MVASSSATRSSRSAQQSPPRSAACAGDMPALPRYFDAGVIRIQRMQEQDGSTTAFTKTAAGIRDIPMSSLLRDMLSRWRHLCPHPIDRANRVFPRLGPLPSSPGQPLGSGGVLSYANFRKPYWEPIFAALGLPYVTPHSARHTFISTLQAQ